MNKVKCILWGIMLLMVAAYWVPAIGAEQDLPSNTNIADKDSTSPPHVSNQGIPCNWSGWKNSFPEVKCRINRCDRYREVLIMKCSDGFITGVKAARVCAGCWDR